MNLKIFLSLSLIQFINCASVEVLTDGPGVLDIPLTFRAKLIGEVNPDVNQFGYVFADQLIYPRHRDEIISGREVNYTITYKSKEVLDGTYIMKVQVYVYVWGFKGWLIAETDHKFDLQYSLAGNINISQTNVSEKALSDSIVATNRTVQLTAHINDASHFLQNATFNYTWIVDSRTFMSSSPVLNYNFTSNTTYQILVVVMCNITEMERNFTKLGQFSRTISAKNEIKEMNVKGNTWLQDGAVLHLQVLCTGGDSPFWYCYEFSKEKRDNYSCSKELIHLDSCSFPITHYFPRNGTHYINIGIYNDVNFMYKNIVVNVYDIVRQTQLSFVIIPIVSSILAFIIVVVGIAYHLQQRQRYNITLEVANFDFQHNEELMEKTFFERLRQSFGNGFKETFVYPCNPCIRPQNYDDLIDSSNPGEPEDQNSTITAINPNTGRTYGIVKY